MHCASPKCNSCSDLDNLSWCASRSLKRACSSSQLHCAQSVCSSGRRRSRLIIFVSQLGKNLGYKMIWFSRKINCITNLKCRILILSNNNKIQFLSSLCCCADSQRRRNNKQDRPPNVGTQRQPCLKTSPKVGN